MGDIEDKSFTMKFKIKDIIDEKVLGSLNLDELAENVFRGEDDPYSAGERIFAQINIDNSGD